VSLPLRTTPEAEAQIREIDNWWRKNRLASPDLFLDELKESFEIIAGAPQIRTPLPPVASPAGAPSAAQTDTLSRLLRPNRSRGHGARGVACATRGWPAPARVVSRALRIPADSGPVL
jgi:hypothetical protein